MNLPVFIQHSKSRASFRFQWAFITYILGVFLDEVFTIDLGIFYFRPAKIGLLVGAFLVLRYCKIAFHRSEYTSLLFLSFGMYNLWWGATAFWGDRFSSPLNQLNVMMVHTADTVFVFGLAGALLTAGSASPILRSMRIFILIAVLEIVAGSLDYLVGHRVIPSGVMEADYTYGAGILGFHAERLIFAEYLVIATSVCLGCINKSVFDFVLRRIILVLAPVFLMLLSSYTGILAYLLFMSWYFIHQNSNWRHWLLRIIVISLALVIFPVIYNKCVPEVEKNVRKAKFERRLKANDEQSKGVWRYVASDYLIKEVINHPTLFGNGYLSTEKVLNELLGNDSTPHTIASIPYEQGIIGFFIFTFFLFFWTSAFRKAAFPGKRIYLLPKEVRFLTIAISCCAAMRILFYYQLRNHPVHLLSIALLRFAMAFPRDKRT
jgi:hypothetical protein